MSGKNIATGAVVGAALAPFTGGLSLLGGAALGGLTGAVVGKNKKLEAPVQTITNSMPTPDANAVVAEKRKKIAELLTARGSIASTKLTPERRISNTAKPGENLTAVGYAKKIG